MPQIQTKLTNMELTKPRSNGPKGTTPIPSVRTSFNKKIVAPPMAGIAIKNENLAAASRFNPPNSPPTMVEPLRDTPGITAIT